MAAITCTSTTAAAITAGTVMNPNFAFAGANHLALFCFVHTPTTGTAADVSSITGGPVGTVTKYRTQAFNTNVSPSHRVEIWYGVTTAGTATLNVTFPAAQGAARLQIYEFANVDLSKGASGLIQSAAAFSDVNQSLATNGMAVFTSAQNAGFSLWGFPNLAGGAPKAGWTEMNDQQINVGGYQLGLETQFKATADNSPQVTPTGPTPWGGVAVEIAGFPATALAGKASIASNAKQGVVLRYR
jgi:hypothetical protein